MTKRRFERAPFQGEVAICRNREALPVRGRDVGAGGILFEAPEPLALKSLLTLHVVLPGDGRGLTVMGRVVRAAGPLAAVEFVGIMPSQQERVRQLVASNAAAA